MTKIVNFVLNNSVKNCATHKCILSGVHLLSRKNICDHII